MERVREGGEAEAVAVAARLPDGVRAASDVAVPVASGDGVTDTVRLLHAVVVGVPGSEGLGPDRVAVEALEERELVAEALWEDVPLPLP